MASQQLSGRAASRARRQLQVNGKGRSYAAHAPAPTRQPNRRERKPVPAAMPAPTPAPQAVAPAVSSFAAPASGMSKARPVQKSASRLRREALASRGKRAETSRDRQRDSDMALKRRSAAEAKVAAKGDCGCGGPCCQEAKAKAAAPALNVSAPAANTVKAKRKPMINNSNTGRMLSRARRAAMSGRGKAGLEAHSKGNSSAALARQANPEISSRDLARVVRDSRSKSGARGSSAGTPARARRPRNAAEAKQVSGTKVGHTEKLTGDETGLCHSGITGTEYLAAEVFEKFCSRQGDAPKAVEKVVTTETFTGNTLTSGARVNSSTVMTGADKGSCREVTGTEYLGREHFQKECNVEPQAGVAKISTSKTTRGTVISGPKSSRAENVTGNERGSCTAVSGTSYVGGEQFSSFCTTDEQRASRTRGVMPRKGAAGRDISGGSQPALVGKEMTGTQTGACQPVSGTPYLAETELKAVCGAVPAQQGEADFPQVMGQVEAPIQEFSVAQSIIEKPAVAPKPAMPEQTAAKAAVSKGVTGSGYGDLSSITGAFSMGAGKVTGTDETRLGSGGRSSNIIEVSKKPEQSEPLAAARVTGEGIETGLNITGDDWDRGERVTGTEGQAAQRNPSRKGAMSAMPLVERKREPQRERPSANVTGGSGGSEGAAFVTVSGGARG